MKRSHLRFYQPRTRLQCAKCHHHPYERWGQADYYGLAGFFTRLGRKNFGQPTTLR